MKWTKRAKSRKFCVTQNLAHGHKGSAETSIRGGKKSLGRSLQYQTKKEISPEDTERKENGYSPVPLVQPLRQLQKKRNFPKEERKSTMK